MNCWMFPGQPLRHDQSLLTTDTDCGIAEICRSATGFDPCRWEDCGDRASEHVRLQIYGTAASLQHCRLLRDGGGAPDLIIEHSMGIYAALAASGSIREQDALELTARVGDALYRMSRDASYALGCVIGLATDRVERIAADSSVYLANYNTASHFLMAGERNAVLAANESALAAGAFSVSIFDCDAPLHTPLIEPLSADLATIFADYHFADPRVLLLNHINQRPLNAEEIPFFLLDELLRPVWWQNSYLAARAQGASRFIEVGAGQALTKLNRWVDSQI